MCLLCAALTELNMTERSPLVGFFIPAGTVMPLTVRRITPVMLRQLENLTEKMEDPATSPEEADLADPDFHLLLLKACGYRTLQVFGRVLQALFREEFRRQYRLPGLVRAAAAEHRKLVTALKNSDEAEAVELIANHIRE